MDRFKPTGYTEYSPVYVPPEPTEVTEPDYSLFTFRSKLNPQCSDPDPKPSSKRFSFVGQTLSSAALTETTVEQLLTSPLISSPFVLSEEEFSAPGPRLPFRKRTTDPTQSVAEKDQADYEAALGRWHQRREQFEAAKSAENWLLTKLHAAWVAHRPEAVQRAVQVAVDNSNVPWPHTFGHRVQFRPSDGVLLVEYSVPDVARLSFVSKGPRGLKQLGKLRSRELQMRLVYTFAMRMLFDLASLVKGTPVAAICLNGHATFIDKTNGHERTETILSVLARPDELLSLQIERIDPQSAFRALKGAMTANLSEYSPIPPILQLDKSESPIAGVVNAIGARD